MVKREKQRDQELADLKAKTRRLETDLKKLEEEKERKRIVEEIAATSSKVDLSKDEQESEDRPL